MSSSARPPLSLRHIALTIKNLEEVLAFYTEVLGFVVEWRPDPDNVYLRSHGDNLALHRGDPEGAGALDHLGFLVPRPEDVDAWAERIKGAGVTLEKEVKTHRDGARSFYFRDPAGNLIQILYHPPISPLLA